MAIYTPTTKPKHEQKVSSVVKNETKTRKKTMLEKFRGAFIEETAESVRDYVIGDLVIPAIKDAILGAIEMMLYGTARRSGTPKTTTSGYTPYNKFSGTANATKTRTTNVDETKDLDYRDIVFETRADAEDVYAAMVELCNSEYGQATICDFFDASNRTNDNYTLENIGWKELPDRPRILHVRGGGFVIDMPKPVNL